MANDAALASSLLDTDSKNTRMMFMLFVSIALIVVAFLALFKPAYIKYAYIVAGLCFVAAIYHGFKMLIELFG
jgi:hypothetical protein